MKSSGLKPKSGLLAEEFLKIISDQHEDICVKDNILNEQFLSIIRTITCYDVPLFMYLMLLFSSIIRTPYTCQRSRVAYINTIPFRYLHINILYPHYFTFQVSVSSTCEILIFELAKLAHIKTLKYINKIFRYFNVCIYSIYSLFKLPLSLPVSYGS